MLTDYKIKRTIRGSTGDVKVVMVVYEGAVSTESELNPDTDHLEEMTRYRRTKLLRIVVKTLPEKTTNEKIREHCDVELNTDDTRTSIEGQKRTALRE